MSAAEEMERELALLDERQAERDALCQWSTELLGVYCWINRVDYKPLPPIYEVLPPIYEVRWVWNDDDPIDVGVVAIGTWERAEPALRHMITQMARGRT